MSLLEKLDKESPSELQKKVNSLTWSRNRVGKLKQVPEIYIRILT